MKPVETEGDDVFMDGDATEESSDNTNSGDASQDE